ncbi:MAG: LuxR C-terminal-related transcriptional regulator [Pseudomonadota bacterium]
MQYYDLFLCSQGPQAGLGANWDWALNASFQLDSDAQELFPYLNAAAEKPELFDNPPFIRFTFEQKQCTLYPRYGLALPFFDQAQALSFVEKLMEYLNRLSARTAEIKPNSKLFRKSSVLDILRILPRTNCRECGFPTCLSFAAMVGRRETPLDRCPHVPPPISEKLEYQVFDRDGRPVSTVAIEVDKSRTGPPPAAPAPPGPLPAGLTRRELEVLRLVSQGAANPEISRQLNISPHTVKSHLLHIFNKTGLNDRTQAAVWAARNNLV